jgi:hypothetical protein
VTRNDALELMRLMRMDLTQLQARLSDLMRAVAASDWTDAPADAFVCDRCGVRKRSSQALTDHLELVHDVSQTPVFPLANNNAGTNRMVEPNKADANAR